MNTAAIRQQLHNYLETADAKKINAIYIMVEDDIKESAAGYTEEFKAELDRRVNDYLDGKKMVTSAEMNKKLSAIRKKRK